MTVWLAVWDTDNGVNVEVYDSEEKAKQSVISCILDYWVDPHVSGWSSQYTSTERKQTFEHVKHLLEDNRWGEEFDSLGDLLNHLDDDDWVRIEEAEVA